MTDPLYDITGIKLAEVEKPAQKGRDPLPNPLLDLVKTRKVGDKAVRFSIPFGSLDIAEKRRKAILRDLTRSGQELGFAVRRTVEIKPNVPGGSEGDIIVTFWLTEKPGPKTESGSDAK